MSDVSERVSDERLAEMLAGLDKLPHGPWFSGVAEGKNGAAGLAQVDNGADMWPVIAEWPEAAHISRCDPETIRSLILELQSLRSSTLAANRVVDDALLERVAKAIATVNGHYPDGVHNGEPIWLLYVLDARAALRAVQPSIAGEAEPYEVVGTTSDGVDILAPAVASKNFTREEIKTSIARAYTDMPPSSLPPKPLPERLLAAARSLHRNAKDIGSEYSSIGRMLEEAAYALQDAEAQP